MSKVLVTGGSSGIGGAIARSLAALGHQVAVLSRRDAGAWPTKTPGAKWIPGDLADADHGLAGLEAWLDEPDEWFGAVFHCAAEFGPPTRDRFDDVPKEVWLTLFNTNVHGAFALMKAIIPRMTATGRGLIVNVTSQAATEAQAGRIGYSASKAASQMLFATLAVELEE